MSEPGSARPADWLDHWPVPPAGSTEQQVYEWRLRHQATDAISAQTSAMAAALAVNQQILDMQGKLLAAMNREDSYAMRKVLEALRASHRGE